MTIHARFRASRLRLRGWTPRRVRLIATLSAITLGLGVIVAVGPATTVPSVDSLGPVSAASATR